MTGSGGSVHRWASRAALRLYHLTARRGKGAAELRFWRDEWNAFLEDGGLWGPDTLELSGDEEVAPSYEGRRWQQARAEVHRVLREAGITDSAFFAGKVVLDIGPGPVGFPDACPAAVSIAVEPLADVYAAHGLLLESKAVYLTVGAERIPLRSESVDAIVCRNSLDHVRNPRLVVREICRLLRPDGELILNVDVDHAASRSEPHELTLATIRKWMAPLLIVNQHEWDRAHGTSGSDTESGHAVVIRARKPAGAIRSAADS